MRQREDRSCRCKWFENARLFNFGFLQRSLQGQISKYCENYSNFNGFQQSQFTFSKNLSVA
jgi:hypothetical protein